MRPLFAFRTFLNTFLPHTPFFLLSLLLSCGGNENELRLESRNFDQEIQQEQNLVFTFDKELVSPAQLQKWDTVPYIHLTPAVPGRFKWTAPNELVFSPLRPFAPSTDFQAELGPELLRHSKQKYQIPAGQVFRFHTPYLQLEEARAFWAENDKQPGELEARVELSFNYPVGYSKLRPLLHLYQGQRALRLEPVNVTGTSLSVSLRDFANGKEESTPLRLQVDPGLVSQVSAKPSRLPMEKEILLPSRQYLQVSEVTTGLENGQEHIYVATTQPVQTENLQQLIKIEPRVGFTVETMEGGFVIRGDMPQQNTYELTISKDLKSLTGIRMGKDYFHALTFASLQPDISFVSGKGTYLGSQGARNIALNLNKVDRIKVSIGRVYENNILRLLKDGKFYEGDYDEEADQYRERSYYPVDETNGSTVFEREYDTRSLRRQGQAHLLHLDLDDLDFDSHHKGLYVVTVTSTNHKWLGDSRILSVSDIGLIARQGKKEVVVFANSLRTAQVQPGVEVRFISTSNQVISTATTDPDGLARLNLEAAGKPFKVGMITARLGADFTYLPYSQTQVNTSRFEVGGKRLGALLYDAYLYGDRDLYRPGDVVYVNTLVRTPDWKTVAGLPLKLKLLLPNGRELSSRKGKLNGEGAWETSFPLAAATATGTYTLELYSGNDVLLSSRKIGVEEFMPDRLKVSTTLNKTALNAGDSVVATLQALQLFGPPAAGRNYEMQLSLKKKLFEAKKYPDYTFNIVTADKVEIQQSVRQGQTDEKGRGRETFALEGHRDIGLLEGSLYTTVFDETGRPVNRLARFEVRTQPVYFGIREFDPYVSTQKPLQVPLLALNADQKPVSATARVQLVRFTYESVIERSDDNYNYRSQRKENIISSKTITIPAAGTAFRFTPLSSGEYQIRVMRPGALHYVAQDFYAYGWGDTESTSFEVSNEGEVDIALDKESYEVGEEAKVLFKSPFAGKILVTVEREGVMSHHYLETDKKAASLTLPIREDYLPTVYITATALRPIKDNSLPLTIARGFQPLAVTRKSTRLDVAIDAPELSRSQRQQVVRVRTAPNAQVTLAVVDEGILQLKDYVSPDPHAFFYQKRALEVDAYDLYPFLFPELAGRRSAFGGDGYDLARRINPLTSKRVKLVALWSGQLQANNAGEATVKVQVPEFSGALRLMAVAYKDQAFGSAEKMMRVADPIVISTALPRFLSPRDTVLVPVTLSNTTGKAGLASSSLSVSGPLRIVGEPTLSARLAANGEARVVYRVVARDAIGAASVQVQVKALGETFRSHTDISVRPAAPLTALSGAGTLSDGAGATLPIRHDFLPASVSSRLVISRSPIARFTDDITYLLQYPHGCLEQTTSRAFPLLYFSDLARSLQQQGQARTYNPNYLVQEALIKIEAMQQYNGGFTYWPGASQTDWWTSAYAVHFLLEARKAGYPVSKAVLDKAITFLQRQVKNKATEQYRFYNASRKLETRFLAAHEITYSLYVLCVARQPDWSTMNYYKSRPELLSLDARYLLASAYALSGRRESFRQVLPPRFAGQTSVRALDGSFYSPTRDMALALNGLLEADPGNPQVGTLARHLSEELRTGRWFNTQERAFALMALGKLARRSQGSSRAQVFQNGKLLGSFTGKDMSLANKFSSGTLQVKTSGTGTLYYFWEASGIPRSGGYKKEDQDLQVRKAFFDRNGRPLAGNTFRQNDLVVVRLSLQSLDGRNIPNVALTDLLPAGFEIENPRLSGGRELPWVKEVDTPEHTDIRDDRILVYATAKPKPQYFYYQVRAVSPGTFQMGPVGADAMYNAEYHSYSGDGVVRIR